MKTKRINDTDYLLVEQFMHYLCSISPTELTTFYCETCHGRLGTAEGCRPVNPFQEGGGTCSGCNRHNDISNPLINRFLNERGLHLEERPFDFAVSRVSFDETIELLREWLIPYNYTTFRQDDQYHLEEAQFTWVKYGRAREKRAYRDHGLSDSSKALLATFYPLCYSDDRFKAEPIVESAQVLETKSTLANPELALLLDEVQGTEPSESGSTFNKIRAFVASIL